MFKKLLFTAGITFSIMLILVSSASAAITFYQTDGIWGRVDDGYDGIKFDVVGVIGSNPGGGAWTATGKSTANYRLIRNATVCTHDYDGDATLADWTGATPPVYTSLGSHTINTTACNYQGLFISEYIEGANTGTQDLYDAIEIYNNMGISIDLTPFSIQVFSNGNSTPTAVIPLSGTIGIGATFVIGRVDIPSVAENLVNANLSFDGNDAVALVRNYIPDPSETGESEDSATGLQYATGPTGLNPTVGSMTVTTNPNVQMNVTTDFNQIRYGQNTTFSAQSGLAFQGINNSGQAYQDENAFLAGKFCHVNNPISADNAFNDTFMTLNLDNIGCGTGAVAPFPPPRLTFVYPVNLDETPNSGFIGSCPYPSTVACSDAVTFGTADATFTCFYQGNVRNTYYVQIVGFMPATPETNCSSVVFVPTNATGIFISNEGNTNCGCLFAEITESFPTAVDLISFAAVSSADGVLVSWETAHETNNLGFNLYRADALEGERVLLNQGLILPNVPPGSPIGAAYEYTDTTAKNSQTYYYWLEDVDISGATSLHGPAEVTR